MTIGTYTFHEFFAGSGLVSCGLAPYFEAVWANDISETKAGVYRANLDASVLHVGDVSNFKGNELPSACLSWASFPCQDLSLAGKVAGIQAERSGLVWQWLRILDEQGDQAPRVICLENVSGLVSSHGGRDYRLLHEALASRGYKTGAILLNANRFVPQSRPRIFVMATRGSIPAHLAADTPTWLHPQALRARAKEVDDFVLWCAEAPPHTNATLADVLEDAPFDRDDDVRLIPPAHVEKFLASGLEYTSGYKRTRNHRQVLELRCDGLAGCLRTPAGGSSRQFVIKNDGGKLRVRLMTVRETARLMGAPETYVLPGTYNDGYMAMGDAVVAPVAHWLAKTFLSELVEAAYHAE